MTSVTVSTILGSHELSTGHRHDTSLVPLAAANRAAAAYGSSWNVAGAAASAAASAAVAAWNRAASTCPVPAITIPSTSTANTMPASAKVMFPASSFNAHHRPGVQSHRHAGESCKSHGEFDGHLR